MHASQTALKKPPGDRWAVFSLGWKIGFEPTTSGTTIQRSNQLSYIHRLGVQIYKFFCSPNPMEEFIQRSGGETTGCILPSPCSPQNGKGSVP
jgi:hypothetical protein